MSKRPFVIGGTVVAAGILALGIITPMFIERVSEGNVAVVYSPNGGAKEVLEPGWHLLSPFQKTTDLPVRIQTTEADVAVSTKDGKKVTMKARYEYKVDKAKALAIFKELGSQGIKDIEEGYLYTKLFKASRETVSDYSLLDIYSQGNQDASAEVTKSFRESVEKLGFIVQDVTLGTPEADAATQSAIDARVKAAQENELKKQELENEKIEAEKKKVIAEGEAAKALIAAEAEAKANKIISDSITPELLDQMEAQARIEHGWVTVQGGSAIVDAK